MHRVLIKRPRLDFYKQVSRATIRARNHKSATDNTQKRFICQITGHSGLNFFEALESEVSSSGPPLLGSYALTLTPTSSLAHWKSSKPSPSP